MCPFLFGDGVKDTYEGWRLYVTIILFPWPAILTSMLCASSIALLFTVWMVSQTMALLAGYPGPTYGARWTLFGLLC